MEQFRFFNEHILISNYGRVSYLKYKANKPHITYGGTDKDGYLRVTIDNKMCKVHRLVWETFNGTIPDGYSIHHLDENKQNNKLDNLALISNYEHNHLHKIGNKYCVGREITDETRKRMSDALKGRKMPEEIKQKISNTLKGRVSPMKGRKKIRETSNN